MLCMLFSSDSSGYSAVFKTMLSVQSRGRLKGQAETCCRPRISNLEELKAKGFDRTQLVACTKSSLRPVEAIPHPSKIDYKVSKTLGCPIESHWPYNCRLRRRTWLKLTCWPSASTASSTRILTRATLRWMTASLEVGSSFMTSARPGISALRCERKACELSDKQADGILQVSADSAACDLDISELIHIIISSIKWYIVVFLPLLFHSTR